MERGIEYVAGKGGMFGDSAGRPQRRDTGYLPRMSRGTGHALGVATCNQRFG